MASRVLPCTAQPTAATEVQYHTVQCCNHVLVVFSSKVPAREKRVSFLYSFSCIYSEDYGSIPSSSNTFARLLIMSPASFLF